MSRGRRKNLGLIALFGPLVIGVLLTVFGGWQYNAAFEAALMLFTGVGALALGIAMLRGRTLAVPTRRFTIDFNKRRWLWIPVSFIIGTVFVRWSALDIADWFVPPDRLAVVLKFTSHSFRSGTDTLHTDQGQFRTPYLVDFDPDPPVGPVIITIGHFSGELLRVQWFTGP